MVEALMSLIIVAVAIISIAGGLLVSSRVDNRTNEQQRANLALATFVENLDYLSPGGGGCGTGGGPPAVSSPGVTNAPSHAATLLSVSVGEPEVQEWIDRGMMFRITGVEYASAGSGEGTEVFGTDCSTPALAAGQPYYPVIRIQAEACQTRNATAVTCDDNAATVGTDAVRRGGRNG